MAPAGVRRTRRKRNHIEKPSRASGLNVGSQPIDTQLALDAEQPQSPPQESIYALASQSNMYHPIQSQQPYSPISASGHPLLPGDGNWRNDATPDRQYAGHSYELAGPSSQRLLPSDDSTPDGRYASNSYSQTSPTNQQSLPGDGWWQNDSLPDGQVYRHPSSSYPQTSFGDQQSLPSDRYSQMSDGQYASGSYSQTGLMDIQSLSGAFRSNRDPTTSNNPGIVEWQHSLPGVPPSDQSRLVPQQTLYNSDRHLINRLRGQNINPHFERSVLQPRHSIFSEGNNLHDSSINSLYGSGRVVPYQRIRLVAALAPLREGEVSRGDTQVIQSVKTTISQRVSNERLLRSLPSTPPPQSASVPRGESTVVTTTRHNEPSRQPSQDHGLLGMPRSVLQSQPVSYEGPPDENAIKEAAKTALKCIVLFENPFPDNGQREDMVHQAFLIGAESILRDHDKAKEWVATVSAQDHRTLSLLISTTRSPFKALAQSLVLSGAHYDLCLPLGCSPFEDQHHKQERVSHLQEDLRFFLRNNNGVHLPDYPTLISVVLQAVFPSHGGKLSHLIDTTRNLDSIFALAGTAIYCALIEYRSGTYRLEEFGQGMQHIFTQCLKQLVEIRRDERLGPLLIKLQEDVMRRGKAL